MDSVQICSLSDATMTTSCTSVEQVDTINESTDRHVTVQITDDCDDSSSSKPDHDEASATEMRRLVTFHDRATVDIDNNRKTCVRSYHVNVNRKLSSSSSVIQPSRQSGRSLSPSSSAPSSASGLQLNAAGALKFSTSFIGDNDTSPHQSDTGVVPPSLSIDRLRSTFHHAQRRPFADELSPRSGGSSAGQSSNSEDSSSACKVDDNCLGVSKAARDSMSMPNDDVDRLNPPFPLLGNLVRPLPIGVERRAVTSCRNTSFSVDDILNPSKFTGGSTSTGTSTNNNVIRGSQQLQLVTATSGDATTDVRSLDSPTHHQPPPLWNPWIHRLDLQLRAGNDAAKLDLLRGMGKELFYIYINVFFAVVKNAIIGIRAAMTTL
jgi:hypothetical protein